MFCSFESISSFLFVPKCFFLFFFFFFFFFFFLSSYGCMCSIWKSQARGGIGAAAEAYAIVMATPDP